MKKLLLAVAAVLALSAPANAAIVKDLGVNPTSATGFFGSSAIGEFDHQYTFQLVGAPLFITFASATNDFINASQQIANFTGQLFDAGLNGVIGGGDDIAVAPSVLAGPCAGNPSGCQVLAGFALLDEGNYFLNLTGIGGANAGYGGNLTTNPLVAPIPEASTWAMMILGFLGVGLMGMRKARQNGGTAFRVV
jgi:opacity protein-like surface antigen